MSSGSPQRRFRERFGSYNNLRSNPFSNREKILDLSAGTLDPLAQMAQSVLENSYTIDSLSSFGNTFRARVLGVTVGRPARHQYPELYSNSTTVSAGGVKEVPDYYICVLRDETDYFTPNPDQYCVNPERYVALSMMQGSAISDKPVAETLEPFGEGDIVEVFKPNQNSWNGAKVKKVVVRNNFDVVLPSSSQESSPSRALLGRTAGLPFSRFLQTPLGSNVNTLENQEGILETVTVPADEPPEGARWRGSSRFRLREDVARAYLAARQEALSKGGIITSAGGLRSLSAEVTANRSPTSLHYLGRAFDLSTESGMGASGGDLSSDPYIITEDPTSERNWIVWAKSNLESIPEITLEGVKFSSSRVPYTTESITGRYFNLTEIFRRNGFDRIRALRRFYDMNTRRRYGGAEWWHFQYEPGLVEGQTTFANELERIYTREFLGNKEPYTQFGNRKWNGGGFF